MSKLLDGLTEQLKNPVLEGLLDMADDDELDTPIDGATIVDEPAADDELGENPKIGDGHATDPTDDGLDNDFDPADIDYILNGDDEDSDAATAVDEEDDEDPEINGEDLAEELRAIEALVANEGDDGASELNAELDRITDALEGDDEDDEDEDDDKDTDDEDEDLTSEDIDKLLASIDDDE